MPDSAALTLMIGGVFSIVVAVISGLIANLNARSATRASLNSELGKIVNVQVVGWTTPGLATAADRGPSCLWSMTGRSACRCWSAVDL